MWWGGGVVGWWVHQMHCRNTIAQQYEESIPLQLLFTSYHGTLVNHTVVMLEMASSATLLASASAVCTFLESFL